MAGYSSVIAFITTLVLLIALLSSNSNGVHAKVAGKQFRSTLTTLTMGDLPDLEKEQPTTLDDVVEDAPILGAAVSMASKTKPTTAGQPSDAELSSFQQFLAATTPSRQFDLATDNDLSGEGSGSGTFSGSDSGTDAIGWTGHTTRVVVDGQASLQFTIESISEESITLTFTLNGDDVSAYQPKSLSNIVSSSLPRTETIWSNLPSSFVGSVSVEATHEDASASSLGVEFAQWSTAPFTFGISTTVTGASFTYSIDTADIVSTSFKYLVLSASASVPTAAYIAANGVAQTFSSSGVHQVSTPITITNTVSAYGSYVFYVAYINELDGVQAIVSTSHSVSYVSPCASTPCSNSGVCTPTSATAYTCDCSATDYEGVTCGTKIDNCASAPCSNGGTCIDGVRSFTCNCASGYNGTTCAGQNFCVTQNVVCQNGGVCTTSPTEAICTCASGWTGSRCASSVNDCAGSPCLNGGTCVDGHNSYRCNCATGYNGTTCSVQDFCVTSGMTCQNGGTCTNGATSATCTCATGFTGYLCQTTTSVKCLANPCQNGGTCTNATASPYYVCTCPSNYIGDKCQTSTSTGIVRPTASIRIVQVLSITSLAVENYPTFMAGYVLVIIQALGVSSTRFAWIYFGPKRTGLFNNGFSVESEQFEAQWDLLAPSVNDTSSGSGSNATAAELFATLQTVVSDPTSNFYTTYGAVETLKSCEDGTTAVTCPTTSSSSSSSSTGTVVTTYQEGTTSNSTWIALGCAVGAFFAILAGILCYCQRKRPQRINQSNNGGYGGTAGVDGEGQLLGGNGDLQAAWDDAHPQNTFVEMQRQDVVLSPAAQQAQGTRIQ